MTLMDFNTFKSSIRLIETLLPKEKSSLLNLIKDMTEVYIKERYPIHHTLFELSKVDGIPNGAEVLERKEVKIIEFVKKAKEKGIKYEDIPLFTQLTLSHPDWKRDESFSTLSVWEIPSDTLLKWEYPSKVKEYSEYLDSLPNVINTYTDD